MARRRREGALQAEDDDEVALSSDAVPGQIFSSDEDDDDSDPLLVPHPRRVSFVVEEKEKQQPRNTKSTPRTFVLHKWLRFYVQFLQASPIHQDRLLKALQWTAWLTSFAVESLSSTAGLPLTGANNSAAALRKLSTDLAFARYARRLLEWPMALQAALTGGWATPSPKKKTRALFRWFGRCLSWSMVSYYPAEHAAYLLWMLPQQTPQVSRRAAQMSAWSCRCWVVYVVTDLVQSVVQRRQILAIAEEQKRDDSDIDPAVAATATQLRLQAIRNALFLLPVIHWSLPNWDTKPWLSIKTVNGLMWLEAMVCLVQTSLALPAVPDADAEKED